MGLRALTEFMGPPNSRRDTLSPASTSPARRFWVQAGLKKEAYSALGVHCQSDLELFLQGEVRGGNKVSEGRCCIRAIQAK